LDDPDVVALANLVGVLVSYAKLDKTTKKPLEDQSLEWLRNNYPLIDDMDSDSLERFAKLASIPTYSPETKEHNYRHALHSESPETEICRIGHRLAKEHPAVENVDDPTLRQLSTLPGLQMRIKESIRLMLQLVAQHRN
jgi:hypothetical protein